MSELDWSQDAVWDLVARARPLSDRLIDRDCKAESRAQRIESRRRLDQWRQVVADNDETLFERRLSWDGLTRETAARALRAGTAADNKALPTWAVVLDQAIRHSVDFPSNDNERLSHRFIDAAAPFPFEEILAPLVLIAQRQLSRSTGYSRLFDDAQIALERSLLHVLTSLSAPTIYSEFSLFRAQHQSSITQLLAHALHDSERMLYLEFVRRSSRGGFGKLLIEYAALARLLGQVAHLWVEANAQFLVRLLADAGDIHRVFGIDVKRDPVIMLQPGLSDPHNGRGSVMALIFASGHKLIYKPRSVGLADAYHSLLDWLNVQGLPLKFRVLKTIDRNSHGWMEYVEHLPCGSKNEVENYFQRAGMLLCLVHALGGTDFHHENIIASGENPMLIDVEMLLCQRLKDDLEGSALHHAGAFAAANEILSDSVLSTGLLPELYEGHDGEGVIDASGFSGSSQATSFHAPKWDGVNTDRMVLERASAKLKIGQNVVSFDGGVAIVNDYCRPLIRGFKSMYRTLLNSRDALLDENGPLGRFAGQQVRYVHRPTKTYAAFERSLLNPKHLRDGIDRGIQIDLLSRELIGKRGRPEAWPLLAAEARAIEQGDIPHLSTSADSTDLELPTGETIKGFFKESSFDLVCSRIFTLSEADMTRQLAFIKGSLGAGDGYETTAALVIEPQATDGACVSMLDARASALAIGDEICAHAISAPDGSATWIGPHYIDNIDLIRFQPLDFDLYDGACGVALFLSALTATTGSHDYRSMALAALKPLRYLLANGGDLLADRLGIGGGTGIGGIVYSLVRVSTLLSEPTLMEDASIAARLITPHRITRDKSLDVVAGAAGAILGLLSLYEANEGKQALDASVLCGEHLLTKLKETASHHFSWSDQKGLFLTGFSHGAAGIAYALSRLYEHTNDKRALDGALKGIAYENSLLDRVTANWPDLLTKDRPKFLTQWCHGAPGIGLSRLGSLSSLGQERVLADIEIALETTERHPVSAADHLCCGNFGRIDFLLSAGMRLGRPALTESARQRAAIVLSRNKQAGHFALDPLIAPNVFSPGLFLGIAGIGYELLRLADPQLPSVLLWEA